MKLKFCFLAFVMLGLVFGVSALQPVEAQSNTVDDPEGKYSVTLPNADWLAISSRDGLGRPQVEIVYKVREDGLLKVRRLEIEKGSKLLDVFKRDEGQTLTFLPGYTKGALEDFSVDGGKIPAAVTSYDFTQGGRPKKGRNYYLQVNDTTVYLLRFTGNRGTMEALRSQTDAIARSFRVK
ncbi:MAG TPA: hypothetical protein VFZ34_28475 [Blastocatellia bacterium]|nr:hypothetical protein [Blastocatellia bacterium]